MTLSVPEARLVAVYRAIEEFDNTDLISTSDIGDAVGALQVVFDIAAKEKGLNTAEMNAFLVGFVGGLGASRLSNSQVTSDELTHYTNQPYVEPEYVPGNETISGGPSGGVVAGQIDNDPAYVAQTGVKE